MKAIYISDKKTREIFLSFFYLPIEYFKIYSN